MEKVFILLLTLLTVSNAMAFGDGNTPSSSTSATLQVRMTDSEISSFGLIIEIVNVEVYSDQTGWITLNDYQQSISSVGFTNGDQSLLANATVPAGSYTKLRLTFGEANSVYTLAAKDRKTKNLWFLTENKQVEIAIYEQIEANQTDELLINFDVATSVTVLDEEYILYPVLEEIREEMPVAVEAIADMSLPSNY